MRASYKGIYKPTHPKKYAGDPNRIVYRSLLERRMMVYLDKNDAVEFWASEEIPIIYRSPIDYRIHRYYPDFIFKLNEVSDYIYNELKDIFKEIRCRMDWGKQVCEIRRNEGVMINNSLSDIRETIKSILIEKNKSSINISPTFIDACLSNYCINDNCFPLKSDNNGRADFTASPVPSCSF